MMMNRVLHSSLRRFGGSKPSNLPTVEDTTGNTEIRDKLHLVQMSQQHKYFLPEHSKVRRSFTLYNFFSLLPTSVARTIGRLAADTKVKIQSDNLYLPRLTKNGVPIYESFANGSMFMMARNCEVLIPLAWATGNYPLPMAAGLTIGYFFVYRHVVGFLGKTFVIKMELIPETEEIVYQKVGPFGFIETRRAKIDDLEYYDKENIIKDSYISYAFLRSILDRNMFFRLKSTKEILAFDNQGYWFEEGLNHELMI